MKKSLCLLTALLCATAMVLAQPTGSKGGRFSVANGVQVRFSQGNLQFNVSQGTHRTADGNQQGTFRFAENQYDTIGAANKNISVQNYNGWISLFGWGTSGYNGCSPMTYLKDATYGDGTTADIAGTNYDWGVYNAISNGGNQPGMWRTLTRAEWAYLLTNRANAEQLYSMAKINGIGGLMILPDDWTQPSGITFTPKMKISETTNVYTLEQWQTLENAGAIFFPKEGYRNYSESELKVTYSTGNNYYAISTNKSASWRYVLSTGTNPHYNGDTYHRAGVPVRLARTVEEYTVTFKDWDGTTLKTENIEYGFAANPPAAPTREGYTFSSWQANVSGMQINYITGEVTFTAQYEKYISYTVTFIDGATKEVLKVQQVKKGESATAPTIPTHVGWTSQGWDKSFTNVQADLVVTALYEWDETAGRLNGKFTVADGKQVYFSKGNLMYRPSNNEWRFHAYQYDYNGDENLATNVNNPNYTGWLDLFTWSNTDNNFGVTTSYDNYEGIFVDWGTNPIWNGGNKAYAWYTLSQEEWEYLFQTRTNAASKYSFATLNGSRGMVILPDDWTLPSGLSFTAKATDYTTNTYSANQWERMEANGAVFLMQTAYREGTDLQSLASTGIGLYRSTGKSGFTWMKSGNNYIFLNSYQEYTAMSVRLVRPVNTCEKTSSFTATAIGSYVWEGMVYTSSGAFTRNFRTAQGCDSLVTLYLTINQEQPAEGDGLLNGQFSVSADQQVRFAKGNLQYKPAEKTWRFANNQYDIIGQYNSNIIDASYQGWIDLFLWSSSNNDYGTKIVAPNGEFQDWGNNRVLNGGNKENFWQTLTIDQWTYLLQNRTNAAQLWGKATVNSIHGFVLLPDNWTLPSGLSFTPAQSSYESNVYTPAQWTQMEANGAVFLPATGDYSDLATTPSVRDWNIDGDYFSSSGLFDDDFWYGQSFGFHDQTTAPAISNEVCGSVRLVRVESKPVSGTLTGKFSVSTDKQVLFSQGNLQYQASTNTWQFAASQTEYIGAANNNVSPTYNGWIDLFGWGTGANPTNVSRNKEDYQTFVDWGTNPISNGGSVPNVWRTLSKDEWDYIYTNRPNANQLRCMATVNGVKCLILLPDDWVKPSGISLTADPHNTTTNVYTSAEWTALEEAGAILIPVAGIMTGNTRVYDNENGYGGVWTSSGSPTNDKMAAALFCETEIFTSDFSEPFAYAFCEYGQYRCNAFSVRLVRDFVQSEECTSVYSSFTENVCEPYTWDGTTYSESGDYEKTYVSANGCDSIVTLHLTVHPSYNIGFGEEAIGSYTWQGTTYTESGDYTKTLQTVNGCDSVVTLHLTINETPQPQKWENGVLPGKFTVAANRQVQFSQGNLQYKASDNIWQFAEKQTDFVGDDNANIAPDYDGWIDLFGWGTGNNPTLATREFADYATFTDWGVNAISNGGNQANIWRTLTADEWEYLFMSRPNASSLFALGTVNGIAGAIILPDDWETPADITFHPITWAAEWKEESGMYRDVSGGVAYSRNTFTLEQWERMEALGALFLPCASRRWGTEVDYQGFSWYWSSTEEDSNYAYCILHYSFGLNPRVHDGNLNHKWLGDAVRLVKEAESTCQPVEMNIAMQSCDLYRWNGVEYTQSGNYTQTFPAANGCDSIVNMALTITPSYHDIDVYAEAESSYTWEGETYTQSGDYEKWLYTDKYLCDSVVTLHLTITGGTVTPVGDQMWRADDDDIKILGNIESTTTVRGLTFVATSEKPILVDNNNKSYNDLTFTYRIKFNGTGSADYRHLRFDVNGDCYVEIYGMSASGSATRALNVSLGTFDNVAQTYDLTGDVLNYNKFIYTGPATTVFLSSANSGINICAINLVHGQSHEGIENVESNEETTKVLLDGQVYILRNGKRYTILGAEVR